MKRKENSSGRKKLSRKGEAEIFMPGLVLLFLVAIIFLFGKLSGEFRQPNDNEGIGTRQAALLQAYGTSERMLLYIDTASTFAAYDALHAMLLDGAVNPASPACGTYATYQSWSSPGKQCFPQRKEIDERFGKELLASLDTMLKRYPGMPPLVGYDVQVGSEGGTLTVDALARGRITLPIVSAKTTQQRQAEEAALEERAARSDDGAFEQDTALEATVVPSDNRGERKGAITHIVVLSSGTADISDALDKYVRGDLAVHYLVGKDGTIVQLVPEEEGAAFCDDCAALERESVSVALVNAGNFSRDPCDGVKAAGACWDAFPQAQHDALVRLAADIAYRDDIAPERLILADGEASPGPAFTPLAQLVKDVSARKGELALAQESSVTQAAPGTGAAPDISAQLAIRWPTEQRVITSCWGSRYVNGKADDMHDGIDIAGDPSKKVVAAMGGTVKQVCAQPCGGFGNSVLLDNGKGILTRYSHMDHFAQGLKEGAAVSAGDVLGFVGHTGNVEAGANHLDLKVFTNGDTATDHGKNPLCFFPESELRTLRIGPGADSCRKYTANGLPGLTHANPLLAKECAGVAQLSADLGCFAGSADIRTEIEGDKKLTSTLKRLQQQGLTQEIEAAAKAEGVDPRVIMGILSTESLGEADILNSCGAVGIGQFLAGTANDANVRQIFGGGVNSGCRCAGACKPGQIRACHGGDVAACAGDPRLDAKKGVRALTHYFALQRTYLGKADAALPDATRFMIASYNQGAGTIQKAIAQAKARGKKEPAWEDVAPFVNAEGRGYVKEVMAHYAAQGGTSVTAFSDQVCAGATQAAQGTPGETTVLKDLGQYAFAPSFAVRIPDPLGPVADLSSWAKKAYDECDGSGDNRECLLQHEQAFAGEGAKIVPCASAEGDANVAMRLREMEQDCADNRQDGCFCAFDPNRPSNDVELRLYAGDAQAFLDGNAVGDAPAARPSVPFALTPADKALPTTLSLLATKDGKRRLATWKGTQDVDGEVDAFASRDREYDVPAFMLYKNGTGLAWVSQPGDAQMCGAYKTQYRVCAQLSAPAYSISDGNASAPIVRFALTLRDTHPPSPVSGARAQQQASATDALNPAAGAVADALVGVRVAVSFSPSASTDVSYYLVACPALGGPAQAPARVLGREMGNGRDVRIGSGLTARVTCKGVVAGSAITITPYDMSGLAGPAVAVPIEKPVTAAS